MEDREIVARCLNGETAAFEMIVLKYQPGLLAFAWSVLKNKEEARDIAQDALIQSYLYLGRYDRTREFKNWLYSIAYRKCLDLQRKKRSFQHFANGLVAHRETGKAANQAAAENDFPRLLGTIWRKLNARERAVIALKIRDGYTAREIAGVLGCSESTARVYFFHTKRKIKKWLEANRHV
jgi:RNA polymerase sigma-70 factor (ECF subfamily)